MKGTIKVEPKKGEKLYLKKGFLGWKIIHPIKEEGRIVWKNLMAGGSWWNLIIILVIVLVTLGVLYEYSSNVQMLLDCFETPDQLEECKKAFAPWINYGGLYTKEPLPSVNISEFITNE